jgi:chromosome partitioning protein
VSKIIAVANKKGGAGKSTLAINLAAAAAAAEIPTAIIDLDPDQQAASKWRDSRTVNSPTVLSAVYSRLPQR